MKEIEEILKKVSGFRTDDKAILATVVDVRGSGYRLPGARMLMLENGDTFGMVSGGCLEADVLERAKKVLKSGQPEVFTYDTTSDENSVFSLNMGCRGVVRILLEPVGRHEKIIRTLQISHAERKRQAVATLITATSDAAVTIGGRAFYAEDASPEFMNLPGFLTDPPELSEKLLDFFASQAAYEFHTFEIAEGTFEFAFENIVPPVAVMLFGAGSDAVPLASIIETLGWQLAVYDHRPAFLTRERFASAGELIMMNRDDAPDTLQYDTLTAAVVMNHNYERDRRILPALLRSDAFYIAALGPKRRTEQMLGELAANGETFTAEQLAGLHAPAGLDTGADTPESIALSIAAEIQSVLKNRNGGRLRDRQGSIYGRN